MDSSQLIFLKRVVTRSSVLALALIGSVAITATAGSAQQAVWAGSIRCEIQSQAPGYFHQETQVWTLTGGAPTVQGSVTVYPATWSVTGQGSHDQTRNANRRLAQWTVNVPGPNSPVNAPIGFTLHAGGRQFDVAKWHAQLTAGGGYAGTDQFINDGVPQPTGRLAQTLYEWQFPKIEAAATETQLTGSHTSEVRAFVGPLQPGEAQTTVTCTWALGRGSAPPLAPPTISQPPATSTSNNPATNPSTTAGGGTSPPSQVGGVAPVPSSPPPATTTDPPPPATTTNPPTPATTTNPPPPNQPGTPVRTIQVNTPTGPWIVGQSHTGTWTHNIRDGLGFNLGIAYTLENGGFWNTAWCLSLSLASPGSCTGADQLHDVGSPVKSARIKVTHIADNGYRSDVEEAFSASFPASNPGAGTGNTSSSTPTTPPQFTVVPLNPQVVGLPTTTMAPPAAPASPAQQAPAASAPTSAVISPTTLTPGGGLTALPGNTGTAVTPATAVDPANFNARQTADGTVILTWDPVPGAGSYMLGGPGTNVGVTVNGTSHTVTGIPQGAHTWTVATLYSPGGVLTTPEKWSKATLTVVSNRPTTGVYLVTVTGLVCLEPTADTSSTGIFAFGDPDGRGDEIRAGAYVRRFDRKTHQLLEYYSRQTLPYGDITVDGLTRLQAGTQTSAGGIRAGDRIPTNLSVARVNPAQDTSFPWRVWEGRLTDGIDVLLVSPSVWEFDGGNGRFDNWVQSQTLLKTIFTEPAVQSRIASGVLGPVEVGVLPNPSVNALTDSPIGRRRVESGGSVIPNVTIVLTREIVEKALSSAWATIQLPVAPGVMLDIPKPGIIVLNFTDPPGDLTNPTPASYTMFLQVEKLSN